MTAKIIISAVNPEETRMGIVENGRLMEYAVERNNSAQLVGSIGMFWGHETGMRILQFTFVSPAWLVYNFFMHSIGGILCEIFNMTSILVYFVRTRLLKQKISK